MPKQLPGSPLFIVEGDHEVKDERKGGLEWIGIGQSGSGNNEQVEETECCEADKDPSNGSVDGEKVIEEEKTQEEERNLKHEG